MRPLAIQILDYLIEIGGSVSRDHFEADWPAADQVVAAAEALEVGHIAVTASEVGITEAGRQAAKLTSWTEDR